MRVSVSGVASAATVAAMVAFGCAGAPAVPDCSKTAAVGLGLDEAQTIVAEAAKKLAPPDAANPLLQPKSLDDATEILKSDQIDLFPAGVEFTSKQTDVKAQALQAQIELAWGEALLLVADLFADLETQQRATLRRLEARNASGEIAGSEIDALIKLKHSVGKQAELRDALTRIAAEHVANGSKLSKKVLASAPNDYMGYRLAADYYRMRGNWAQFDQMMAKIKETNPNSNGLVFLQGMGEIQHAGHIPQGTELLRQALAKDPKFVRAQAEIVAAAATPDDMLKELGMLAKVNPNHQIVRWVGPFLKSANAMEHANQSADPPPVTDDLGPPPI